MFTEQDAHFHDCSDDPFWNESGWFSFCVPERNLNGFIYFYHRPNMRFSKGGIAVWDPSGERTWNCRFHDWDISPLAQDADMFDFTLQNGLSVTCVEPLKRYRFSFASPDIDLRLEWQAFMSPNDSGFPAGQSEAGEVGASKFGKQHWEQGGRMAGTVTVGGERLDINCFSMHDRSWGVRVLRGYPSGDMPWGIASEDHAFCLISSSTRTAQETVAAGGSLDEIVTGWYLQDGKCAALTTGTRTVERDPDGRPTLITLDAEDSLGRHLDAVGRPLTTLDWHGYPNFFIFWGLIRWELGGEIAHGESQDFHPLDQIRALNRGHRDHTVR